MMFPIDKLHKKLASNGVSLCPNGSDTDLDSALDEIERLQAEVQRLHWMARMLDWSRDINVPVAECYSTREAAEAAKEEK